MNIFSDNAAYIINSGVVFSGYSRRDKGLYLQPCLLPYSLTEPKLLCFTEPILIVVIEPRIQMKK
jgi:hypothetical protein